MSPAAALRLDGPPGKIRRLVIVTDAWEPQINGVVRTLRTTAQVLRSMGVEVSVITPQVSWGFAAPAAVPC